MTGHGIWGHIPSICGHMTVYDGICQVGRIPDVDSQAHTLCSDREPRVRPGRAPASLALQAQTDLESAGSRTPDRDLPQCQPCQAESRSQSPGAITVCPRPQAAAAASPLTLTATVQPWPDCAFCRPVVLHAPRHRPAAQPHGSTGPVRAGSHKNKNWRMNPPCIRQVR
jgi:hypothetical protein